MSRIVNAGGFVNAVGRINGNLNLSRSLGDLKYKQVVQCAREEQVRDVVFCGSVSARMMVLLDVSYFIYPIFPLADDHRGAGHHADAAAGGRPLLHPGLRRRVGLPLQPAGGTSAVTLCLSVCDTCMGCSMALSLRLFADAVSLVTELRCLRLHSATSCLSGWTRAWTWPPSPRRSCTTAWPPTPPPRPAWAATT
jgi:hypothetical protein